MISVQSISKRFRLYRSPADRLKEILTRRQYHTDYDALKDVSFSVADGETLGIVGQNGAGKSTLLKIVTGILLPDAGTISIDGKITGLLELGTGFNAEMTGIENIFMNGALLGMSREEIDQKKDAIIDFTELGGFIYEQIKTYSSGMVMRLAFSIAIHADPKCFVVDEALSVGDAYFQQKCIRKIIEFKGNGGSIIFVSHDMNSVKTLCDSAILLDKGRLVDYGDPKDIIDFYQGMILKKSHTGDIDVKVNKVCRKNDDVVNKTNVNALAVGTGEVELLSVKLLDENNNDVSYLESEKYITIEFTIKTLKTLADPHYGIMIRNRLGVSVFETNTCCMNIRNEPLHADYHAKIAFKLKCNLFQGDYSISIGVADKCYNRDSFEEYLLLNHDVAMLKIIENMQSIKFAGVYNMNPDVRVEVCFG
jgi:ABC-type polysaccharide/polyol phosphate transport system ATPase subunit